MCGRYGYTNPDKEKIKKRFRLKRVVYDLKPSYNIAPTQDVPAILNRVPDEVWPIRWGLVPFWAKDIDIGSRLINARAETVTEKPAFRKSIRRQRCLILADCFYEWKKEGVRKQPYCIHAKGHEPFAFAGIWDVWETDGNQLHTCAIITCEPNATMKPIHNRMPVILDPENEEKWLKEDNLDEVKKLLIPAGDDRLEMYPISTLVNSPQNNSEEILQPI